MRLFWRLLSGAFATAAVVVGILSLSGRAYFGAAMLLMFASVICNTAARSTK